MGGPSVPQAYKPTGTGFADTSTQQNLGLQNQNAQTGSTLANNVVNNPWAGGVIPGAKLAGDYLSGTLAPNLQGASADLFGAAKPALAAGSSLLNTAFDPQNALFARTQGQLTDATNAQLARSGVASSPYGAGVANKAESDFLIDWQNNQLSRELAGLSGYDTNLGSVGQAQGRAGELGTAGAAATQQGAALPYNAYNSMQGAGLEALSGASSLAGDAVRSGVGYLGYDTANYGNQLGQYNAENKGWGDMFGGIGDIFGLGSSLFGEGIGGGGAGSFLSSLAFL